MVASGEIIFPNGAPAERFRLASFSVSLPWFDETLNAQRQSQKDSPVKLFVMGKNKWRCEQEWPLARTRYTPYYLRTTSSSNPAFCAGELSLLAPRADEPDDDYLYDPLNPVPTAGGAMMGKGSGIVRQNEIESRSDVLTYTTCTLTEDIEVTGPVTAILYVSTSSPCTDFTAKLVDVHPDGAAFNVCDGILRRRYEKRGDTPEASRTQEIKVQLWPTSMVFLKGHQIRLEISSSNFPRFDRNPNTGNPIATETEAIVANQIVRHGLHYPSRLILPVIPEQHSRNIPMSFHAHNRQVHSGCSNIGFRCAAKSNQ